MKRFVSLLFMIALAVNMFAQDLEWKVTVHEADPMTNKKEYTSYSFTLPNVGSLIFWNNSKRDFRLVTQHGIFNYFVEGSLRKSRVKVGLYDANNKLIDKFTITMYPEDDDPSILNSNLLGNRAKKVLDYIRGGVGGVRFVAPIYGEADFDAEFPCYKEPGEDVVN